MKKVPKYWCVVPAAGIGSRVGADCPKQYLKLGDKTILQHTVERLLAVPQLARIILAVSSDDQHWQAIDILHNDRIEIVIGGTQRCDSVLNGLHALANKASDSDWVLVHDVARPCITQQLINKLIVEVGQHEVGGILAIQASDTLKQVSGNHISGTLDRSFIWQAQTPQMFRYQKLLQALTRALAPGALKTGEQITDEASALEWAGMTPCVVEGSRDNIKVTLPEDIALATFFIHHQQS